MLIVISRFEKELSIIMITIMTIKMIMIIMVMLTSAKGPVYTNPFSNENGAVLLRIRLSSTLQRRKRSPKTEPLENALQSGTI